MDAASALVHLTRSLRADDRAIVERAYHVAERAHRGQRRRHGVPYIEHPLAVTTLLVDELGVRDPVMLAAALLHDVLEDCDVTPVELRAAFPARTCELVELLTDPSPDMTSDERRRHYKGIWADPEATILKGADRLGNLRDCLLQPDPGFQVRYARRTRYEVLHASSPLSHHELLGPLLEDAVIRCEEASGVPRSYQRPSP